MEYLYHGSCVKLNTGDKLHCNKQYNSNSTRAITGVFATSLLKKAKYFGIMNCIRGHSPGEPSRSRFADDKIYLEDISKNIQTKFYVYLVSSAGFVLDARNEYVCETDVEICDVREYDLVKEIETEKLEIYLTQHTDIKASTQERIEQMSQFIKDGKMTKIEIAQMIQETR